VFTLNPASVSSPTSDRLAPYSRSKTRRSRKNGSSDWPAQVSLPPPNRVMPSPDSEAKSGMEACPTLLGTEMASSTTILDPAPTSMRERS